MTAGTLIKRAISVVGWAASEPLCSSDCKDAVRNAPARHLDETETAGSCEFVDDTRRGSAKGSVAVGQGLQKVCVGDV